MTNDPDETTPDNPPEGTKKPEKPIEQDFDTEISEETSEEKAEEEPLRLSVFLYQREAMEPFSSGNWIYNILYPEKEAQEDALADIGYDTVFLRLGTPGRFYVEVRTTWAPEDIYPEYLCLLNSSTQSLLTGEPDVSVIAVFCREVPDVLSFLNRISPIVQAETVTAFYNRADAGITMKLR
jgi:hypothetical protein